MFKPEPWQTSTPDGAQRPVTTQVNVQIPADADQSDAANLMKVAQDIIYGNITQLQRWLNNLRLQVSSSQSSFLGRQFQMPGMTAQWSLNNGYEKLILNVFPSSPGGGSQTSDINLDGYICWVHADPNYPDVIVVEGVPHPAFPGPYNIFFNGYLIEQNFQPLGPVGGYPILFGKTALLCQSYVGSKADGNQNPLLKESQLKPPNLVIPPAGWGAYTGGTAPDQSTGQPKIPKMLGYWLFDWLNGHNPWQYVQFGGYNQPYQNWQQLMSDSNGNIKPQFEKGLYFKSSADKKSPLKPKGQNGFSVSLSPQSKGAEEVVTVDIFIGEFYDRGAFRTVSQSWTIGHVANQTVSINDKPLIYGAAQPSGGFSSGGGMTFNLDPAITKVFSGTNANNDDDLMVSLMGPHDGLTAGSGYNNLAGLNDDQLQQYKDWEKQVQALASSWETQISQQLIAIQNQLTTAFPLYQNAYKAAIVGRYLQANTQAYDKYFDDYLQYYANPHIPENNVTYTNPVKDDTQALPVASNGNGDVAYSVTYGPMQGYYIDLTPDLNTFIQNINDPLPICYDNYLVISGTTGNGPQDPGPGGYWSNTTTYAPDDDYTFLKNKDDYLGPAQPSGLLALIQAYISKNATNYLNLVKQYQAVENSQPPNAPPVPTVGDDYTAFGYSNISISGTEWDYEQ